jgi:DNA-binding winged helix-turn-helix (wHTH) protein
MMLALIPQSAEISPDWSWQLAEGVYGFEPFELDAARRHLSCRGRHVALTARGFDLLLLLILNRHRMLSRAELLQCLWPDVFVEDANLSVNVSLVRKVLGEDKRNPRYIATLPRRGYRFVAEVQLLAPPPSRVHSESGSTRTLLG